MVHCFPGRRHGFGAKAGMECRWQVEIDDRGRRVFVKHWPNVSDLLDADNKECEPVNLIAGGFPCQDISHQDQAGITAGSDDSIWTLVDDAKSFAWFDPVRAR